MILTCRHCAFKTNSLEEFRLHCDNLKCSRHKCEFCQDTLNNASVLKRHLKNRERKIEKCTGCGLVFCKQVEFMSHRKFCKNNYYQNCLPCGKNFTCPDAFAAHCKNRHESLGCNVCNNFFKTKEKLASHLTSYERQTTKCDACDRTFCFKEKYTKHLRFCNASQIAEYVKQDKRYELVSESVSVSETHKSGNASNTCNDSDTDDKQSGSKQEKRFKCPLCLSQFTTKQNLKVHENNRSSIKLECNKCLRIFCYRRKYHPHIKVCKGISSEIMSILSDEDQACVSAQSISEPEKVLEQSILEPEKVIEHSRSEKEKVIEQSRSEKEKVLEQSRSEPEKVIEQSISEKEKVLEQSRSEKEKVLEQSRSEKEKRFKCPLCRSSFTTKEHLRVHVKNRSVIKIECDKCSKEFCYKRNFQSHVKVCNGLFREECTVCGKEFDAREGLDEHETICREEERSKCTYAALSTLVPENDSINPRRKRIMRDANRNVKRQKHASILNEREEISSAFSGESPAYTVDISLQSRESSIIEDEIGTSDGDIVNLENSQYTRQDVGDSCDKSGRKNIVRDFKCTICRKTYPSQRGLNVHDRNRKRIIECGNCKREFCYDREYTSHLQKCFGRFKGTCYKCGTEFFSRALFEKHEMNCQEFIDIDIRNNEITNVTNVQRVVMYPAKKIIRKFNRTEQYPCPFCYEVFQDASACKSHIKFHGHELFEKEFKRPENEIQTGSNMCCICGYRSVDNDVMRIHLEFWHYTKF